MRRASVLKGRLQLELDDMAILERFPELERAYDYLGIYYPLYGTPMYHVRMRSLLTY